jgi:diguanylate cyclase (GGDEF)-like protein/PAS domain S-box-containing protein
LDFPQKGRDRVSEGLPDSAPEPGHADDAPSDAVRFQSQLLGAVGQAIIATDLQGTVLYWNGAAERLYGWSPQEVEGRALHDFLISEGYWEKADEIMAQLASGRSWSGQFTVRRKDGDPVCVEVTDTPVHDQGSVVGVIGVSTDITERKRAEARLRESERRLSTLLSHAPALVYRCLNEPDWPEEYVSEYALELTGYSAAELMENPTLYGSLISEEDRQRIWDEVQGAVGRGERFRLRYAIRHRGGNLRFVEEVGQGVSDESGDVVALEGLIYDVTERERAAERLREAEHRYRTLVERIPAIVYVQELEEPSRMAYVSPQNETILGYTPEECLADPDHWINIIHPDDRERVLTEDARISGSGEPFVAEYRQFHKDGRTVWIRDEAAMVRDENGLPLYWLGVQMDITEREVAEERLRTSEAELRALFEAMDDVVFEIDTQGRYLKVAPTNPSLLYRPREELLKKRLQDVLPSRTAAELLGHIRGAIESRKTVKVEYSLPMAEREARFEGTITPLSGESVVFVGRDVTELKELEERLAHRALHDPLTDLPNRTLFTDRLRHALVRTKRRRQPLAVMFMDLDNFKVINDSLGHKIGDRLLVAATKRIRNVLRPEDTVARLGGDEFVFLLEETDLNGAIHAAERILELLRKPFKLGGRRLFVTASVGIAVANGDGRRTADLLRNADLAMYRAKQSGKACYVVYEESMNSWALERLELEQGLGRAVERDEFVVHYHPEVSLSSGKIVGLEALARWEHPERGLLLPEWFAPVAEETGLIVPIGEAVLTRACRRAKELRERWPSGPPAMCVNLSARQIMEPGLAQSIARILGKTDLEPSALFLELTESAAMGDALANATVLEEIRDLGVRMMLDDFGTGHSSLSHLERLPVDYVKIDRSFIGRLGGEHGGAQRLVSGIIGLAHALELKVVAEGVETHEQLELLRAMGCDWAQGHLFSEPLPAESVDNLLAAVRHRDLFGGA